MNKEEKNRQNRMTSTDLWLLDLGVRGGVDNKDAA